MIRWGRTLVFGLASMTALVVGAGCNSSARNTEIADVPAYYGRRPNPVHLPPKQVVTEWKPEPKPEPTHASGGAPAGWVPRGGISDKWQCIVIHHAASDKATPQGMRDYHVNQRGWDALGYHFVIGGGVNYGDGQIFVGERWTKQMHGAHCKTPGNFYNEHGIGICLIGNLDSHPPTQAQLDALARLITFLTEKCGIPRNKILTHGGVTHKTACPGSHFSLQQVLKRLPTRTVSASSR